VFCTNATGFFQTLPECLPGPVPAHLQVIARNTQTYGHLARIPVCEFQLLNQCRILGFERWHQFSKTSTKHHDVLRFGMLLDIRSITIKISRLNMATAVEVDDGTVDNVVEPGNEPIFIP